MSLHVRLPSLRSPGYHAVGCCDALYPFTSPPPGREGYLARARQFADATQTIVAALKTMPGLRLLCEPDAAIIAFTSDAYDIFSLIDRVHTSGASVPVIICPVPCGSVCCRGFSWHQACTARPCSLNVPCFRWLGVVWSAKSQRGRHPAGRPHAGVCRRPVGGHSGGCGVPYRPPYRGRVPAHHPPTPIRVPFSPSMVP